MLNYIANSTRTDVSFATHQCARFCNDPRRSHETEIKQVGKYLKRTKEQVIIISVDRRLGLKCFVDAGTATASLDMTVFSRSTAFSFFAWLISLLAIRWQLPCKSVYGHLIEGLIFLLSMAFLVFVIDRRFSSSCFAYFATLILLSCSVVLICSHYPFILATPVFNFLQPGL